MKVAIVSQGFDEVLPPRQNSVGLCTYGLARHLAATHDVLAFGSDRNLSRPTCEERDGVRFFILPHHRIDARLRRVHRAYSRYLGQLTRFRRPKPYSASLWCAPVYAIRVAIALRSERPDVIHVQHSLQYAPLFKLLNPRAKVVVHRHWFYAPQNGRWATLRRLRWTSAIIGVSTPVTADFRREFPHYAGLTATVFDGVDDEIFQMPLSEPDPAGLVLFAAHISPGKGVHDLIAAFALIAERHPSAKLLIVGPAGIYPLDEIVRNDDCETLARLRPFYGENDARGRHTTVTREYVDLLHRTIPETLKNRVQFVGRVSHAEIVEYMRRAAVLVFPSISEEAFGMPPVEAMALGTPVVATRSGGVVDTVVNGVTGIVVDKGDVTALASAISAILGDGQLRMRMSRSARMDSERRFSWAHLAHQVAAIYEAVVTPERLHKSRSFGG